MDSIREIGIKTQGGQWEQLSQEAQNAAVRAVEWCIAHQHTLPCWDNFSLSTQQLLDIIDESVQEVFGVSLSDLRLRSKKRCMVDARSMVMLIYQNRFRATLSEIGGIFGLHHASAIHNIANAKTLIGNNKDFREKYYSLKSKIDTKCEKLATSSGLVGSSLASS